MKKLPKILIIICLYLLMSVSLVYAQKISDKILTNKCKIKFDKAREIYKIYDENDGVIQSYESLGDIGDELDKLKNKKNLSDEEKDNLYTAIGWYNFLCEKVYNGRTISIPDPNKYKITDEDYSGKKEPYSYSFPSSGTLMTAANNFIGKGKNEAGDEVFNNSDVTSPILSVGQILTTIAAIMLLIITIIMSVKYMTAAPNDQAKLKTQLIGLFVSAAVIFGAYTIWQVSVNLLQNIK